MFREKYKRDNEMINPSEEFLNKLKAEMKKEERLQKNNSVHKSRKLLIAAAASVIIIIGAASYAKISDYNKNNITNQVQISDEEIEEKNGSKDKGSNNMFANSSWHDEGLSSDEIYKIFVKRISSKDDIKELSKSSTNDFTSGMALNDEEIKKLSSSLEKGSLTDDSSLAEENPEYYMASFKNGDIIKFIIYDGKYFKCSDFEGTFLINS